MSHFNHIANEWDNDKKIQMMKDLSKKTKSLLNLDKKYKILDFGCGTGLFGLNFIKYASEILGVDTSEGMLHLWDKKTKNFNNISSKLINLEVEPLNEQFDLILSSMTFHHLEKPSEMLRRLDSMLAPEGKIAIVDLELEKGDFHPDNQKMGVKHFGFSDKQIKSWAKSTNLQVTVHTINEINKNNRQYNQFLAIFRK